MTTDDAEQVRALGADLWRIEIARGPYSRFNVEKRSCMARLLAEYDAATVSQLARGVDVGAVDLQALIRIATELSSEASQHAFEAERRATEANASAEAALMKASTASLIALAAVLIALVAAGTAIFHS